MSTRTTIGIAGFPSGLGRGEIIIGQGGGLPVVTFRGFNGAEVAAILTAPEAAEITDDLTRFGDDSRIQWAPFSVRLAEAGFWAASTHIVGNSWLRAITLRQGGGEVDLAIAAREAILVADALTGAF